MWKQQVKPQVGCLILLSAVLVWLPTDGGCQETRGRVGANLLPPTTGDALTVTPTNMPDITCAVVEWTGGLPKPRLTVVCPPEEMFAPLHVYLKLSWLKSEDVPSSARDIVVSAKMLTKIRTSRSATWVWLEALQKQGAPPRRTWVAFNGVVDIALLTVPGKH